MQRVVGTVHRLGPAAAAASGAVHANAQQSRANVVSSPTAPFSRDEDWVDIQQGADPAEVSEALQDLSRILHTQQEPLQTGPIIEEVGGPYSLSDSDDSDSSSANRLIASIEAQAGGPAPMDHLTNAISNLMANPTVMRSVTDALVRDPNFHAFNEAMGLPAPAVPLLLQGPPAAPAGDGPNLFDVLEEKILKALDALKRYIRGLFPGDGSFRRVLIDEQGSPTRVANVALAVVTIILTKRLMRIPVRV